MQHPVTCPNRQLPNRDSQLYLMEVRTSDVKDWGFYRSVFETSETEQMIEISYDELEQPDWASPVNFVKNNIMVINFQAHADTTAVGPFSISIWGLQAGNP